MSAAKTVMLRSQNAPAFSARKLAVSRQNFLDWVRSDAFVKGHAQSGTSPKDAYFKTNVLELHEVLQDSSRPDLALEPRGGPFNMH
jgi:hypothetical protein